VYLDEISGHTQRSELQGFCVFLVRMLLWRSSSSARQYS